MKTYDQYQDAKGNRYTVLAVCNESVSSMTTSVTFVKNKGGAVFNVHLEGFEKKFTKVEL